MELMPFLALRICGRLVDDDVIGALARTIVVQELGPKFYEKE